MLKAIAAILCSVVLGLGCVYGCKKHVQLRTLLDAVLAGTSLDERLVSADVQRSNAEKAEKLAAVEREATTREKNAAAHRQAEARLRAQEATHRKAAQDADTLARQESANRAAAKERAADLRAQQAKSLEQREQRVLEAVGAERRRIIAQAEAEKERIEEAKALKLLTARKKKAASEVAQAAEIARQEALTRQEAQAAETERQRLSMDRAQQLAAMQKYKKQIEQAEAQAARNAADAEAKKIAREEARAEFLRRSTVASVTRARNAEEAERLATIQREAAEREREVARLKKEVLEAKVAKQQLEQLNLIWEFQCQGGSWEQLDQSVEVGTGAQWAKYSPADSRVLSEEYVRLHSHSQDIWTDDIEPEPEPDPESEFEMVIVRVTGWVDLVRFVEIRPPGIPSLALVSSKLTELVAVGRRGCLAPRIGGGWAIAWDDGESEETFDGFDMSSLGAPPKRGQHVPGEEITLRVWNLSAQASPSASPRGVELIPIPDMSRRQCFVCEGSFGLCQGIECASNGAQRHFFCTEHFNSAVLAVQVEPAALPEFRRRNGVVVCPACRSLDTRYAKADIYKLAFAGNRTMYDDALENFSDEQRTKYAEREKEDAVRKANQASQAAVRAEREQAKAEQQRIRDAERAKREAISAKERAKSIATAKKAADEAKKGLAEAKRAAGIEPIPKHWTIKAGSPPQKVDNSAYMRKKFTALMRESILQGHENGCAMGHDMSNVQVVRVERVENTLLWQAYHQQKAILRERLKHQGLTCDDIAAVCPLLDKANGRVLDAGLNEFRLWHGTKPDVATILATSGFDERVARDTGLYGAGSYFADAACKSNQYATETNAQGEHCMLQCRVLMGNHFNTTKNHQNQRRPPLNPTTPGQPHDSIFAQTGRANNGAQAHNEFIVFQKNQVYPEYILWYK
eukprot:COSAG02_NODE_2207_length_9517_cov_3.723508_1_plen_916_part_10